MSGSNGIGKVADFNARWQANAHVLISSLDGLYVNLSSNLVYLTIQVKRVILIDSNFFQMVSESFVVYIITKNAVAPQKNMVKSCITNRLIKKCFAYSNGYMLGARSVARKKFRRGFKFLCWGPRSQGREAPPRMGEGHAGRGCKEGPRGSPPPCLGVWECNPRKIF